MDNNSSNMSNTSSTTSHNSRSNIAMERSSVFPANPHTNDAVLTAPPPWLLAACPEHDNDDAYLMHAYRKTVAAPQFSFPDEFCPAELSALGLGRALRTPYFMLDPSVTYLNHGSYGACLRPAMARQHAVQRVMERNGIHFFETVPHALRRVAEQLGAFVRAPGGGAGISLVRNATMGVATVLRSMAFAPSDAILVFQFGYPAVKNLVHAVATQFGCGVVQVSVPQSVYRDDAQLVQCFEQHLLSSLSSSSTQKVRVAVFDHIVSSTGDVLPARALVEVCRRHGVLSLVDGAHAVGQLPLDLEALDADFYVSNCHKWLMTPKGCAFLYVREPHRAHVHPMVLSHGYLCGYAAESLWTATDDYSSFYALETSLQFVAALGFERMTTYNAQLCWGAAQMLAQAWGTEVYSPRDRVANLAVVRLPTYVQQQAVAGPRRWGGRGDFWGADAFRIEYLRDEWRIEVPVMCYADGLWYVRLAAQVYLEMADFELLRDAILALKNGELSMSRVEESLLTSS